MTDSEQRTKWQQDEARWRWAFALILPLIVGTLVNAGAGLWWAATMEHRMSTVESYTADARTRVRSLSAAVEADRLMAARLEQRLVMVVETLDRIERMLAQPRAVQ